MNDNNQPNLRPYKFLGVSILQWMALIVALVIVTVTMLGMA